MVEGIACASTVTGRVLLGAAAYLTWGVPGEFDDVKGAEHPTTLSSRSSLAYSYSCADQVAEAIDICEGALPSGSDFEGSWGCSHLNVGATMLVAQWMRDW